MTLDAQTMSNISFWLRQVNAIQLFFCGFAMLTLYFKFRNQTLRRLLRWNIAWFLLYGVFRLLTPVLDYYTNRGYGLSSLVANVVFWSVPCVALLWFIVKIKRGTLSIASISTRTDAFFDDLFRELRHNIRRTDDLAFKLESHSKGR